MDRKNLDKSPRAPGAPIVVIVDADESFGVLLQHFLERRGYNALRLLDARYALRLMRDLKADLLITTLDTDEIDNVELLVGLASEPVRPPVLLCSRQATSSRAINAAALALGVSKVLPRPCRFEVIASAVESLLAAATSPTLAAEPALAQGVLS
jgi:DNA-binding response OmpR family regulator